MIKYNGQVMSYADADAIIRETPGHIRFIECSSDSTRKSLIQIAVEKDCASLMHISYPNIELISWAISLHGGKFKIQYVNNRTPELDIQIAERWPYIIKQIRPLTQKLCDAAVKQTPIVIEFVPKRFQTIEMCKYAIYNQPISYNFMKDPPFEIALYAIENGLKLLNSSRMKKYTQDQIEFLLLKGASINDNRYQQKYL